jgi:hypothetical protein
MTHVESAAIAEQPDREMLAGQLLLLFLLSCRVER